jgi:soluble lytic murein transglycosylase
MSTRSAAARTRKPSSAKTAVARRRRFGWVLGAVLAAVAAFVVLSPPVNKAVQELRLPLQHEDIIRQQALDKELDPALIAGVIYTESRFRDQTSSAGAVGLMQLLPSTADYIAQKSGGTKFEHGDLATPQINIAYGSWYLRYLLDKYRGSVVLALAAYNAGEGKVNEWLAGAASTGQTFQVARNIPFPETREYVSNVLAARQEYRKQYAHELGLG